MGRIIYAIILTLVILYCCPAIACNRADPLFTIERSTNRNIVHYDACLISDSKLSTSDPVKVYWIMEGGQKQDLTWLERRYGYGIRSKQEPKGEGVEISLAAFDRKMLVTKIDGTYRVIVSIKGQKSILDKIYVNSRPGLLGLPKVVYADFIGRTVANGASVVERVGGNAS